VPLPPWLANGTFAALGAAVDIAVL
jgi:hypothetical protein